LAVDAKHSPDNAMRSCVPGGESDGTMSSENVSAPGPNQALHESQGQVQTHTATSASANPRFRIIVVDDSKNNAKVFATLLELLGHETRHVSDGASALHLADSFRPDIIFSDLNMDAMNGCELASRVRAQAELRGVTLVVHSGHSDSRNRDQAAAAGFDFYLVKPAEPKTLRPLFQKIAAKRASCIEG